MSKNPLYFLALTVWSIVIFCCYSTIFIFLLHSSSVSSNSYMCPKEHRWSKLYVSTISIFFPCAVQSLKHTRLLYRKAERNFVSLGQQLDFIKSLLLPFSCSELLCPGDHLLLFFMVTHHLNWMEALYHFLSSKWEFLRLTWSI